MADEESIVRPIRQADGAGLGKSFAGSRWAFGDARQSGYAYIGLAIGYAFALIAAFLFNFNPLGLQQTVVVLVVMIACGGIAALMGWWAIARPGLIKSIVIVPWAALELVTKIATVKSFVPTSYWLNLLIMYWAVSGLVGVIRLRSQKKQLKSPADAFS